MKKEREELDEIRETFERAYAPEAFDTPMMHVAKDTCAAVHFRVEGMAYGRAVVVAEHVNRLRDDVAPEWPSAPEGRQGVHRCTITGNPNVVLESQMSSPGGDHVRGGVGRHRAGWWPRGAAHTRAGWAAWPPSLGNHSGQVSRVRT